MHVAKWGNSLAVRIPVDVARELGLKEGDQVQISAAADRSLVVTSDRQRREQAIARIRELARPLPSDYIFDREEANARDSGTD